MLNSALFTGAKNLVIDTWLDPKQVVRVGNKSQDWSRALLDVSVAYDADAIHALVACGSA